MGVAETEPREAWGWPVGVAVGWPRPRPMAWGGVGRPSPVRWGDRAPWGGNAPCGWPWPSPVEGGGGR